MRHSLPRHQKRLIRFLELWQHADWQIKIYGIHLAGEKPEPPYVEIAKKICCENLPQPAHQSDRYGIAFVTIHRADMFNQIILDWWERVNELRHHVFKADAANPQDFRNITATGEAFCVWELRVIEFERQAWLDTVLSGGYGNSNFQAYLQAQLNEDA